MNQNIRFVQSALRLGHLIVSRASRPCSPARKRGRDAHGTGKALKLNADPKKDAHTTPIRIAFAAFGTLLLSIISAGCKFKPPHNMEEQPGVRPTYKPSAAFLDGASARPVPGGTIPRKRADSAGYPYPEVRSTLPIHTDQAAELDVIPFPVTAELLNRGQQRFDIYCSVCHGRLGDGNGMIVERGLTPPPSFHIPRLRQVSDGHLYNVISNGYGQMFSYNDRVTPEDRWMIVAYIRALQAATASQSAMARLARDERHRLEGSGP